MTWSVHSPPLSYDSVVHAYTIQITNLYSKLTKTESNIIPADWNVIWVFQIYIALCVVGHLETHMKNSKEDVIQMPGL